MSDYLQIESGGLRGYETATNLHALESYSPGPTYGAEQSIVIFNTPNTHNGNMEGGPTIQFVRAGRITRIRYRRRSDSATTLTFNVWNNDAGNALIAAATVTATDAGTDQFEVTLPTPLTIPAGGTRTFTMGTSGADPINSGIQTVTDTTDCTFIRFRTGLTVGVYPDNVNLFTHYVEPIYEPAL